MLFVGASVQVGLQRGLEEHLERFLQMKVVRPAQNRMLDDVRYPRGVYGGRVEGNVECRLIKVRITRNDLQDVHSQLWMVIFCRIHVLLCKVHFLYNLEVRGHTSWN